MIYGFSYTFEITVRNTGKYTWDSSNVALCSSWALSKIFLNPGEIIAPGQEKTFSITVDPKLPECTWATMWWMESTEAFGATLEKIITVGIPRGDIYPTTIPKNLFPGETTTGVIRIRNKGIEPWTAGRYQLVGKGDTSLFTSTNILQIPDGVTIAPGEDYFLSFPMTAQQAVGTYHVGWQLQTAGGYVFYEDKFLIPVQVVSDNKASINSEPDIPLVITAGQIYMIKIRIQNDGAPWTSDNYYLKAVNGTDLLTGQMKLTLNQEEVIYSRNEKEFTYEMIAPDKPGEYITSWQMYDERSGFFGETLTKTVRVLPSKRIAANNGVSLIVKNDGTVWACGRNTYRGINSQSTPVMLPGLTDVVSVSIGSQHCMALKKDGTIWAWGSNFDGQIGNGTNSYQSEPIMLTELSGVASITAGASFSAALKHDGTLWTWGDNYCGQLGDGTYTNNNLPRKVNISPLLEVDVGDSFIIALTIDGNVYSWGSNWDGELGDGTDENKSFPVLVNISNVKSVQAGGDFCLVLKEDGTVWSWGNNLHGELGEGTDSECHTPRHISNLSDVTKIFAGYHHSFVVKRDGTTFGFGSNYYGQLGDGLNTNSRVPVMININNPVEMAGGNIHSLAKF